jgi:hypothetical protein
VVVFGIDVTSKMLLQILNQHPTSLYSKVHVNIRLKYAMYGVAILLKRTRDRLLSIQCCPWNFSPSPKLSHMSIEHGNDLTMQSLYGIAKEQMKNKIPEGQPATSDLLQVRDQTNM